MIKTFVNFFLHKLWEYFDQEKENLDYKKI